jgi:uncharacterized protein
MRLRLASRALLAFALLVLAAAWLRADPALPPKPALYFNDGAGIVDAGTASELNEQLAQFERDTSSQIVVAIYPSLPDGVDLAQYCVMTGRAWGVGQAGASKGGTKGDNGAILFVFVNDHLMYIATGYGLEGALPDITCKQIIDNEITPRFKQGDFAGGLRAGVAAMMAATKGEYKGTGQTVLEQQGQQTDAHDQTIGTIIFIVILVLFFLARGFLPAFGVPFIFTGGGYGSGFGGGGGFGGAGGCGGGGFGGGGGGSGFSGGGGSFGGGGAGGSW